MPAHQAAAKTGGNIAKKARLELKGKTGRKVVSGENFLPPGAGRMKRIKGGREDE